MSATIVNDGDYVEITNLVGHRVGLNFQTASFAVLRLTHLCV